MGVFANSLRRNIERVLFRVNGKCYEIAKELFESVVKKTPSPSNPGPYAQGQLANQWFPEVGGFSEELDGRLSGTGADSLTRIAALRPGMNGQGSAYFRKDGRLTLTNNLSYAYRAEALGWPVKDGWSGQIGPYRMAALSLQAIALKHR